MEKEKTVIPAECRYIIELLRSVLENRDPAPIYECVDLNKLYKLTEMHMVSGMCYYALQRLKDNLKDEIMDLFQKSCNKAQVKEAIQELEVRNLIDCFEQSGIMYMPLKGYIIKNLYPRPDMRWSADVDILYDFRKAEELKSIMEYNGYTDKSNGGNHDVFHKKPVMNVEMHRTLMSEMYDMHLYFDNIWDKAVKSKDSEFGYELSTEDFYIYQIGHLYKHYSKGGSGIRSVIDIYLYTKKYKDIMDNEYLEKEFNKLGLNEFVKNIEKLSRIWFEGEKGEEIYEKMTLFILSSGTFGRTENSALSQIASDNPEMSFKKRKFRFIVKRIFLPYKTMKTVFPSLKKHPYLLPIFWIVRIYRFVFVRKESVLQEINMLSQINEEKTNRMSELREHTGLK